MHRTRLFGEARRKFGGIRASMHPGGLCSAPSPGPTTRLGRAPCPPGASTPALTPALTPRCTSRWPRTRDVVAPLWRRGLLAAIALSLLIPAPGMAGSPKGFWLSLLVPGLGQKLTGRPRAAANFLAVEIGLWSSSFGLRYVSDIREDNFRTFAAEHARARAAGKDAVYFDDLGFYDSQLEHNRFARVADGVDAELYPNTADFFWEWDSSQSRESYRELRNSSETADRQALFAVGLVIANHLVAAVHAARGEDEAGGVTLEPHPRLSGVALVRRF